MDGERLVQRLGQICGAQHVVTDAHALAAYSSDALRHYRQIPLAAVLPGTAEEVQQVVSACREQRVPWVARGAGTGMSGGALPPPDGVVIVLTRLRRIVSVNLADSAVVVEPGVTNLAVAAAVAPTHVYPPDPSSQRVCTIGGNVGENAGGAHCFKYGFTGNYVTGLDVVLPDGSLVELGREAPGYDLIGAVIGSEGTLGIAVRIHLRVLPAPESVATVVAFFDELTAAAEAVNEIIAAALVPAALELMDGLALRAAEQAVPAGLRTDAAALLLIELDGPQLEVAGGLDVLLAVLSRAGAADVRIATDPRERAGLWRTRKAAYPAMATIAPACILSDGVVPRTQLPTVLALIGQLAQEAGLTVANLFHAGDGNLHPLVCYDPRVPGESERASQLSGEIVRACLAAGGSISGEHGIGIDKLAYMSEMFSAADLATFDRLRTAFDPDGLANPGKLLPA